MENGIMKKSLFFAAALLALAACTREMNVDTPTGDMIITARTETSAETKTIVEGQTHVYWEPGDEIKVFTGGKSGKFTTDISASSASATFNGSLGEDAWTEGMDLWAVYPYSEDAVFDGETITTTLPLEQVARFGSFGKGMNLSVAHSDNNNLQFYNVGGGIRFRLTQEGIKKVTFEGYGGEFLAGKVKIGLDGNGLPIIREVTNGSKVITLLPPSGNDSFPTNVWFYCVAIPGSLASGYKLEFYRDTEYSRMASEKAVTIKRSIFGSIDNADEGCVFIPIPNSIPIPEAVDLGLSVKWASFNIGASSPEGFGNYYAWGETQTKNSYSFTNYKWDVSNDYTIYKLTKYCTQSQYGNNGFIDGKTVLEPEDDAAYVNLGVQWRMPLIGEYVELVNKCVWEWTSLNGVRGYKITGPNGGYIFLPAAGEMFGDKLYFGEGYEDGTLASYWASVIQSDDPRFAWLLGFREDAFDVWGEIRIDGRPVRAVSGDPTIISVTGVSLDQSEVVLNVGESVTLSATVFPQDATNKSVIWFSDDESIATVSSSGEVTGIAAGTTTIYAYSKEGSYAACEVTVKEGSSSSTDPKAVDLGLSVKWASFNLGASKPEEFGDYYAWGETEPHYSSLNPLIWKPGYEENGYDWTNYKWLKWDDNGNSGYIKYCFDSTYGYDGFTDDKKVLDPKDDAAHVILGGNWRMPTDAEWDELMNNCSWMWTSLNGVEGYRVTSNKTGNSDQSIFLPAASHWTYTDLSVGGYLTGRYWSSSLTYWETNYAWIMHFNSSQQNDGIIGYARCYGLSIRPVCN